MVTENPAFPFGSNLDHFYTVFEAFLQHTLAHFKYLHVTHYSP